MCKNLNLSKSTLLIQRTMDNWVMLRVGTVVFPREDVPVDYAISGGQPWDNVFTGIIYGLRSLFLCI